VKFLCDRCKTRYSIGDDRVRGKILKIRCKNCANVITVREGMTDADAADPAPRRGKATTDAPPILPAQNGALGAAFANALTTKPPAALEEEWYVSIDGDQSGPFSLEGAQRWVASKAYDADLHCWSEGFDDWLPVDKVSHFRGLRKKPIAPPTIPASAVPPPMPRAPGLGGTAAHRMASSQAQKIDESEPKPLFAATMASLERSVPSAGGSGLSLPSLNSNGAARATPPGGHGAIPAITKAANGAAALKVPVVAPMAPPIVPVPPAPIASPMPSTNGPGVSAKGTATKNAFDVGDQATQIEAPPFDDEALTAAEPAARKKREDLVAAAAANAFPSLDKPSAPPVSSGTFDEPDDDDLQIGEVSRVVKLADLMATKPKRAESMSGAPAVTANRTGAVPRLGQTGAVPRLGNTGQMPRISATGAVARIDDPNVASGLGANPMLADAPSELAVTPAVQANHRRGLFILIAVATLLLAGGVAAVLMLVGGDDSGITTLGRSDTIDTTRPDDPNRPRTATDDPKTGSAANPFFPQPKPNVKPKYTNTIPNPLEPDPPGGQRISGDDVESMARSQSSTTQRCYMRAQRGADAILIGDVKKINVTIEIAPDGTVKTVGLSAHADNTLGKCLSSAIRGWKFRASPGGTYRFALVFSAG
jgi:predicted Zn finger-like uncharacterized protein